MYNRASKAQGKLSSLALMHIHYGTEVNLGEVVDFFCPEAGGRGRLQGKRWFSHQYQCDVTSHIGDFQYGGRIRCSLSAKK